MSAVAPTPMPIRRTASAMAPAPSPSSATPSAATSGPAIIATTPARLLHPRPRPHAPSRPTSTQPSPSPLLQQPPPQAPPPPPPPLTATPSPPPPTPRRTPRPDPLSDTTTTALIRRVLCPQEQKAGGAAAEKPIEDVLPPLTSRNDVDLQLYALVAIIVREYVQSWYAQITPDESFVEEVVRLLAHCTRALESRLRRVDLESLLLDELPDLVDRHISAYRASRKPVVGPPVRTDPRQVYHALCPVPQMAPVPGFDCDVGTEREQEGNETAYRQLLAEGVLAVLLPTEDLENPVLTALIVQILAELIVGNVVAGKLAQPWMIYEFFCILAKTMGGNGGSNGGGGNDNGSGSGNGRRTRTRQLASGSGTESAPSASASARWSAAAKGYVFRVVDWIIVACTTLRMLVLTAVMASSLPSRFDECGGSGGSSAGTNQPGSGSDGIGTKVAQIASAARVPVLGFKIWPCMANLLQTDARMPWLLGTLSWFKYAAVLGPGRVAGLGGVVDRLLSHLITDYLLDPSLLPSALRTARASLFPNNALNMAPGLTPPGSDAELRALRRRCAASIAAALPRVVKQVYFGGGLASYFSAPSPDGTGNTPSTPPSSSSPSKSPPDVEVAIILPVPATLQVPGGNVTIPPTTSGSNSRESGSRRRRRRPAGSSSNNNNNSSSSSSSAEEERVLAEIDTSILDVFSDAYCNKHLVYGILELLLVRLMPELAEKGVAELWEERLS